MPKEIPQITLPATAICREGKLLCETFSASYRDKLPRSLIKDFAGAFAAASGKSSTIINSANREFGNFCEFLVDTGRGVSVSSLSALTPELLYDYVEHLKRLYPATHTDEGTTHSWYNKYTHLRARLSPFIVVSETLPYCPNPGPNPDKGHTPHAMKMMLQAARPEIDRIRAKIGKWEQAANDGDIKDEDWISKMTVGKTTQLTEEQVDLLEEIFYKTTYRSSYREIAEKYAPFGPYKTKDGATNAASSWHKAIKGGAKTLPGFSTGQFERLKKDLSLPLKPKPKAIAAKLGLKIDTLRSLLRKWGGDVERRPKAKLTTNDIDLTLNDIVATINHYLPDWPVVGRLSDTTYPYRVYFEEGGVLCDTFETEAEARAKASEVCGVVVSNLKRKGDSRMNPAERLLSMLQWHGASRLSKKVQSLLPGGTETLIENFFASLYDMAVIYLYWLCLTGWNREALLSTDLMQVLRLFKGAGSHDLLDTTKATFVTSITTDEDENIFEEHAPLQILTGEKARSQPIERPKIYHYTHTSDRDQEYGLFRVLADYYKLTEPLRKYLKGDQVNTILVCVKENGGGDRDLALIGNCQGAASSPKRHLANFFKKNKIYEDEALSIRVMDTKARSIRKTYFSTLQYLGVPITTRRFLGYHESMDTTLLHYADGSISNAVLRENARKNLNDLSDKAFAGTLQPYTQTPPEKRKGGVLKAFTWRENDVYLCKNQWHPTWEGNEKHLPRDAKGKLQQACDSFHMCLFCEQCIVTPDTLKYLVRWEEDLRKRRREGGFAHWPAFLYRRYLAIGEIFKLCEVSGDPWPQALRKAEIEGLAEDFNTPPMGRGI